MSNKYFQLGLLLILVPFFILVLIPKTQAQTFPQLVSLASDESQGDASSGYNSNFPSADARYIAFQSEATNLVPNDTNTAQDIFVRDRVTGTTERVSIASDGSQANNSSQVPVISSDGRFVAFTSSATNLVPNDTNAAQDVFVHERLTNITERVSISSTGNEANSDSFGYIALSADGRYVMFTSSATNLVPNDTNARSDVFVHDRVIGTTTRVSVSSSGSQADDESSATYSSISADGRYIVFYSEATNLVPNDTNGRTDVFVRDLLSGTTELASVADDGGEANSFSFEPIISADGHFVAFMSRASNLVSGGTNGEEHVFVRDLLTGQTIVASISTNGNEGNADSYHPSLSSDGRYVVYESFSSNLIPNDTNATYDVFVYDRITATTERVSVAVDGTEGDSESYSALLTADGQYVAFGSQASNLVSGDTNDQPDSFVTKNPLFVNSTPVTTAFNSVGDTYVRSGQSNQNEGGGQFMKVRSNGKNRALVRFDQSALQSAVGNSTVLSAKLRLTITENANNWGTTGRTVDAHRLTIDWIEGNGTENDRGTGSGATWSCAIDSIIENQTKNCSGITEWEMGEPNNPIVHPWVELATDTQTITNNQTGVVEYDVTSDLEDFLAGSEHNYGWIIKKTNENQNGHVSFGSKESESVPQLVVTFFP